MYVLFPDKVSCPMPQHYDSGDSQISNSSIYELRHCDSKFIIFVNMTL